MPSRVLAIGELLWDVFPDAERLGGAPFNFAAAARTLGHEVVFLTAVGRDARGAAAKAGAIARGLPGDFIQETDAHPTGIVKVAVDARGEPDYTIVRPAAYDALIVDPAALPEPGWLYHGTLHADDARGLDSLRRLRAAFPAARVFYDVNLRRNSYTAELVRDLLGGASVVKMNEDEARELGPVACGVLAVTRGARGCTLIRGEERVDVPAAAVAASNTVGAGDAFAAGLLHALDAGLPLRECAELANRNAAQAIAR